tara:strand:- start:82 stop:264 length:183 start_codon:yes stop_codon:yes gene_type:complete
MIPELVDLPVSDKERIKQGLHWAIAEKQKEAIIKLHHFRKGIEELNVPHYEYSDLYNAFN